MTEPLERTTIWPPSLAPHCVRDQPFQPPISSRVFPSGARTPLTAPARDHWCRETDEMGGDRTTRSQCCLL
eukprot:7703898-Pyramimonas_sp.AAC.1